MHEFSIATTILDAVASKIPAGTRLRKICVTAGPLAGICAESLQFCFESLSGERGHAPVELVIHQPPCRFVCTACSTEYEARSVEGHCPGCNGFERRLVSGKEFSIDSIDVEE